MCAADVSERVENSQKALIRRVVDQIFQLQFMFWRLRHRRRAADKYDLTEAEQYTLATLVRAGTCTVGQLQKLMDVQPAQMSRIIRSLESKTGKPMVECTLNADDKRRIDVTLTQHGQTVNDQCRNGRVEGQAEVLSALRDDELQEFAGLLDRFGELLQEQLGANKTQ